MRNSTKTRYYRWKRYTRELMDALAEEMAVALTKNDKNALRAHMINIQILDHTLSVVKDWMEKGEEDGNQ